MKILNIVAFVHKAVKRYKAQRAKAVVNDYIKLSSDSLNALLPAAMEMYRSAANSIVDRTEADPQHVIDYLKPSTEQLNTTAQIYSLNLKNSKTNANCKTATQYFALACNHLLTQYKH